MGQWESRRSPSAHCFVCGTIAFKLSSIMPSNLDAAALVRSARNRAGLSQRALADLAQTTQSVVARIELGHTSPTVHTVNRLLAAAGQAIDVRLVPTAEHIALRARRFFERQGGRGIISAYLHGSTARGQHHAESDVDVGMLLDRARYPTAADRGELRVRLGADLIAGLGINDVDLVILNDVPPGLARSIVLDGRPLVVFDPEREHAFTRDVQLRWADLQPFLRRTSRLKREALSR